MNFLTRNRLWGLGIAALVFAVDQLVKWIMIEQLDLRAVGEIYLLPFFQFTFTPNYGVSLGMLQATSMEMRWILVGVTSLIALVVLVWMMREKKFGDILGLALILGGALGNIRDRWTEGYVIDYLDLHFGDFRPFYIFNIADAAITIGVLIILARAFFLREKPSDKAETTDTELGEAPAETN
jgi:signal peptidase II